jgi:hypothetical protein
MTLVSSYIILYLQWKLKKHAVGAELVMSVFSIEKPVVELLPLDDDQVNAPQVSGLRPYRNLLIHRALSMTITGLWSS